MCKGKHEYRVDVKTSYIILDYYFCSWEEAVHYCRSRNIKKWPMKLNKWYKNENASYRITRNCSPVELRPPNHQGAFYHD